MPQPTLGEIFRKRAPTREPHDYHAWLSADEKRFILWAFKEQWSAIRIGRALNINEATVRRFRQRFWADPLLLLELGLFEMVGPAKNEEYRCLICSERIVGRREVERHVLGHYVEENMVNHVLPKRRRHSGRRGIKQAKQARNDR